MMPGLVETNQDYSFLESEFLAIGEWDLDLFVVHQQSGEFRSISKTDADTVTVFASCGEMLEFAIKKGMD